MNTEAIATERRLTDKHPVFGDFIKRLAAEVCPTGEAITEDNTRCAHNFRATIPLLVAISGVEVEPTLEWFHAQNCHCDCELLLAHADSGDAIAFVTPDGERRRRGLEAEAIKALQERQTRLRTVLGKRACAMREWQRIEDALMNLLEYGCPF